MARKLTLSLLLTLVAFCFTGCGEPLHSASSGMSISTSSSMSDQTHMQMHS